MLPEWKHLRRLSSRIDLPQENYFVMADEYVDLNTKFVEEGFMDTLNIWIDMVLYPLYIIIRLCMGDMSPMYILSMVKTYQMWFDWFRLETLKMHIDHWKLIVRSLGGPWISSNDAEFHVFVYADGMERIRYSKSLSKSKCRVQKQFKMK